MKKKLNKPTLKELVYFLTSEKKDIPENFKAYPNDLKKLVDYILEQIWSYPSLVEYFQKYNNLYNQDYKKDIFGYLKWLQYIFNENNIKSFHLKSNYFNFYEALNKVKDIEKQAEIEKRQVTDLINELRVANYLKKVKEIKKIKKVEKGSDLDNIKEKIKQSQEKQLQKIKNENETKINSKFLTELNEDVIKELELVLIDVFVDKQKNQFIYIFIDKYYQKKYYKEPFKIDLFISKQGKIIENDYFRFYEKDNFYKYSIVNYWDYNALRNLINKQFKNFKNNI